MLAGAAVHVSPPLFLTDIALPTYRYFSGLIVGCLQGVSKEELLSPRYSPCGTEYWSQNPMVLIIITIPISVHVTLR